MFDRVKSFTGRTLAKTKTVAVAGALAVATVTGAASAQEGGEPFTASDLGEIVFALTPDSVAGEIGAAGATMLGLWAVWAIGFKLLKKFIRRMGSTV